MCVRACVCVCVCVCVFLIAYCSVTVPDYIRGRIVLAGGVVSGIGSGFHLRKPRWNASGLTDSSTPFSLSSVGICTQAVKAPQRRSADKREMDSSDNGLSSVASGVVDRQSPPTDATDVGPTY